MKRLLFILLFVFLLVDISAICNETQIDINSASVEELDKLAGIGPVYAKKIVEARLFNSVDDLVDVEGIGEKTLEKIKEQGLACVNFEEKQEEDIDSNNDIETEEVKEIISEIVEENNSELKELTPIVLNAKDIKSEEDKTNLSKNLAFGGIVTFCIVFGALFIVKTRKRKNEFR